MVVPYLHTMARKVWKNSVFMDRNPESLCDGHLFYPNLFLLGQEKNLKLSTINSCPQFFDNLSNNIHLLPIPKNVAYRKCIIFARVVATRSPAFCPTVLLFAQIIL